jgi:hypothetical protein
MIKEDKCNKGPFISLYKVKLLDVIYIARAGAIYNINCHFYKDTMIWI